MKHCYFVYLSYILDGDKHELIYMSSRVKDVKARVSFLVSKGATEIYSYTQKKY